MADEKSAAPAPECKKCEECIPGLPGWLATFSDMVTLLLTFFILLLSFAKTETAKYEAALGSIKNAFGGNVLKHGEVIQRGKSPDDAPTMLESQEPVHPFPIEFLTMEGMLDKHEINRESTEELTSMKTDLFNYGLTDFSDIYEVAEGIKVRIKEKIFYQRGSLEPYAQSISVEVFDKILKLLTSKKWVIFIEGHASANETSLNGQMDTLALSSARAADVTRTLIQKGVPPNRITTVYYGSSRPNSGDRQSSEINNQIKDQRVEFLIRKVDLLEPGHKVESQ